MRFPISRGFVVFALCFAAYMSNCRTVPYRSGGDTIPNRLIPFTILTNQRPALNLFHRQFEDGGGIPWYIRQQGDALVSFYPIGTALAALPFYVPIYALLWIGGKPAPALMFAVSEYAEKLVAVTMTALAVVVFWMIVRRRLPPRQAFFAALAFAFGTSLWATASQMLWQHTAVVPALTVALWLLTWPGLPRWAAAGAGAALSLAFSARPTAALFLAAGFVATLAIARERWRGHAVAFCVSAVPLIALTLIVNYHYYGNFGGGYSKLVDPIAKSIFSREAMIGILGLLVSPNRGLLIFTPVALAGIAGLARQLVSRERDPVLLAFGAAAVAHLVVMGSFWNWVGGWSFGPRYLVDILPILALAAADLWPRMPRWTRHLALAALLWSVAVQFNGAFCYPASQWNIRVLAASDPPAAAWNWREFELWQDFVYWRWGSAWSTPF